MAFKKNYATLFERGNNLSEHLKYFKFLLRTLNSCELVARFTFQSLMKTRVISLLTGKSRFMFCKTVKEFQEKVLKLIFVNCNKTFVSEQLSARLV